ncbi:SDR family NAD(P)-dependent oxidoreductase [Actinomadura sp. LD22]|uniref:SDR family NAD(P)-dependent oxidoreductase n=1 Tax=Actinomadura physcomitrii TaxID=2650748 RepID=A0A6I4MIQ2_9ACTN|nr:SDR family oxidoreductase [Actinomadura physcomitrii]MWA05563.1 SDR family NAD(P)-dependent oxidoreductase [Actinomadura physcomitrii]
MTSTAFVTGASRGIGKAIAVHLARAGLDVALTARTVKEGERREHSSTLHRSDTSPLPGALSSTAGLVEAAGVRSLVVPADLTDRASVVAAADTVLAEWGRIDVLVNNGRYIGPGHMDHIEETPLDLLELHLQANVMSPLALIKKVLPGMLERGSGTIVNITSGAGFHDPPAKAGEGGWGLAYGFSKAALHRVAGILDLEVADRGVRAFNVQPGFIATERMAQDMGDFGFDGGAPPDVVGAVVAWLVNNPDAAEDAMEDKVSPPVMRSTKDGRNIEAQEVCRDLGLLPGWPG